MVQGLTRAVKNEAVPIADSLFGEDDLDWFFADLSAAELVRDATDWLSDERPVEEL